MSKIEELKKKYENQQQVLFELLEPLSQDQMDWKLVLPLGDDYWSVREILAHIEEVNCFWINKIEGLIKNPRSEARRTDADMAARQTAISTAYDRELSILLADLHSSFDTANKNLECITDEQLATIIEPAPDQKVPLSFLVSHVYPEHVEEHIKHIERQLFAYAQYH